MQLWPHIMAALATYALVCNIFQTISFSREVAVCINNAVRVDGESQLSRLKGTALVMQQLSERGQSLKNVDGLPRNGDLSSVADDCASAAKELGSIVQNLLDKRAKDGWQAAVAWLEGLLSQSHIQALDTTLTGFTARIQLAVTLDEW